MNFGKILIIIGAVIVIIGLIFWLFGKLGLPMGQLPGDINVSGEKYSFSFPIVSSILASIILTIIINVVLYFFRK
jgi:uncharacterized membrane-anchored protein YitT (DUF2179 family)